LAFVVRAARALACCAMRRSACDVHAQDPCQPPLVDRCLEQPCRSRPAAGRLPVAIPGPVVIEPCPRGAGTGLRQHRPAQPLRCLHASARAGQRELTQGLAGRAAEGSFPPRSPSPVTAAMTTTMAEAAMAKAVVG